MLEFSGQCQNKALEGKNKEKKGETEKNESGKNKDLKTFGNYQKSKIMNEKRVMMIRETKEAGENQRLAEAE